MPILNRSSSDCDVVSSSCSTTFSVSDDDESAAAAAAAAGSRGLPGSRDPGSRGPVAQPQQTFITRLDDDDDEYEVGEEEKVSVNVPKKRGPKKKRMTPARIAKLKQRRIKVSNAPRYSRINTPVMPEKLRFLF